MTREQMLDADDRRVGLLTLDQPLARKRWICITLDGLDVTHLTQAADDREGWVCLLQLNAAGRYFIRARLSPTGSTMDIAREVRTGEVRLWRRYSGFRVALPGAAS